MIGGAQFTPFNSPSCAPPTLKKEIDLAEK